MDLVYHAIPVPDKEGIKNRIRLACRALNSYGVTSSQTDDYCMYRDVPWQTVNEAYRELEAEGEVESQTRLENIEELVNKAVSYEEDSEHPSLDEFLEQVAWWLI